MCCVCVCVLFFKKQQAQTVSVWCGLSIRVPAANRGIRKIWEEFGKGIIYKSVDRVKGNHHSSGESIMQKPGTGDCCLEAQRSKEGEEVSLGNDCLKRTCDLQVRDSASWRKFHREGARVHIP